MLVLAQTFWLEVAQHLWAVFAFLLGACVGSFVNVLNHRLPAGMSVISPPSRCPTCGARLRFGGENLPILGWFLVRGRCRYCKVRISPEYMVVELIMAVLFLGLYWLYFGIAPSTEYWGEIGGDWWYRNGFVRVFPAYLAWAFLIAGLVSMTMIDARTFCIPIQVPAGVTIAAVILYAVQAPMTELVSMRRSDLTWPVPCFDWQWTIAYAAGIAGLAAGVFLLKSRRLRYSFADYDEHVKEGDAISSYPYARREMFVELVFLLPCVVGLVGGYLLGGLAPRTAPPAMVQALAAVAGGYVVGGGLVWAVRIAGTFAFGKEAMGLGDVHLLAAVGAVMGWFEPILVFLFAPFIALGWVLLSAGLKTMLGKPARELPFGPHLAVATVVVILARPAIERAWNTQMPNLPMPQPGLYQPPTEP